MTTAIVDGWSTWMSERSFTSMKVTVKDIKILARLRLRPTEA